MVSRILHQNKGEEHYVTLEWDGGYSWGGKYTYTKYELGNISIDKKPFLTRAFLKKNIALSLHTSLIQEYTTIEYRAYHKILLNHSQWVTIHFERLMLSGWIGYSLANSHTSLEAHNIQIHVSAKW